MIVPAKVKLLSVTRRVAWGGTVRITGQLLGGYLPPGGALVRLRIGQGSSFQTYGVRGTRHRQGSLHDHLYVWGRVCGDLQELLVPDRDSADRRLSLRACGVRTPVRSGRRAPAPPGQLVAGTISTSASAPSTASDDRADPRRARCALGRRRATPARNSAAVPSRRTAGTVGTQSSGKPPSDPRSRAIQTLQRTRHPARTN